jgi:hypothetical protein
MVTMYVNGDSHTAQVYGEEGVTATELLAKKITVTISMKHCQVDQINAS